LCYASLDSDIRSASRHQLLVPRYQLSSLGRRSCAAAGPTTWNSLSADLRHSVIRRVVTSLSDVHWKHFCSLSTSVSSALEVCYDDALYPHYLSVCLSVSLSVCLSVCRQRRSWAVLCRALNFSTIFQPPNSVSTWAVCIKILGKIKGVLGDSAS